MLVVGGTLDRGRPAALSSAMPVDIAALISQPIDAVADGQPPQVSDLPIALVLDHHLVRASHIQHQIFYFQPFTGG